jgi:hypothetical protein
MITSKFLSALFLIVGLLGQSLGFAELSTSIRKLHTTNNLKTVSTSTSLPAFFTMPDDLHLLDSPLLRTSMSSLQLLSISPSSSTLLDPNMEAEVLTDMSHLALDFTSIMNFSSKAMLKKTSVIGRILVIFADYIPDHSIHTEELVYQLFLLGVAIQNLASPSIEN